MIKFTVYGEPRGKGRPRAARRGKFIQVYTDDKTASYENLIKLSYINARQENYLNGEALEVNITAFCGIPKSITKKNLKLIQEGKLFPTKKPDPDNIIKCIDGLNGIAWKDDTQIIKVSCLKVYDTIPRLEITIKSILENG